MKVYYFLFFLIINCPFQILNGQESISTSNNLKFKHFSSKEGLSQSSVIAILQDRKGYFWFGTRDGLNKYDGHTFKIYRYNSQDSCSLSNNIIRSLYEDDLGNLWIGTLNGLNKYVPEEDNFIRITHTTNDEKNKTNNEIWSITSEDKENLWLGTNFGLVKFNIKNKKAAHFIHENNNSLFNINIRALLKTTDGNLWVCTTQNIAVFNPKTDSIRHYEYPKSSSFKERNQNYIPAIYEDSDANLWLGSENGLAIFDKKQDVFKTFKIESNEINVITDEIRTIHQDYLNNLWVGTYKGLYIVKGDKSSILNIVHDDNDTTSLSQNSIYKIIEDSRGDIWIGTYAGGVNYYDRSFDLFKNISSGTNNSKLNYKVVSSIIEDPDANLWIATEGGGINFFNKKTGKFNYFTHQKANLNSLSANNVKSMIRTRSGNFWIGTHDGGLNFFNPKKKPYKFKKFINKPNDTKSLSNNRVISLFEDGRNNIWIGTSGGGLNLFNNKTQSIIRVKDSLKVVGNLIYTISKTSKKNILLIGGNKGLAQIDIDTYAIKQIQYKKKHDSDVISTVLCVYEDHFENLWIGTEGDGLYYFNSVTNGSVKYGISQGLPNEVIYGILPDDDNNIWLSTNYGLSRFDLKTHKFKNFDESDGLQSNEFNNGAYLKTKSGELMFGGANGLNYFKPTNIVENTFIPTVDIYSLKVSNKPFLKITDSVINVTLKHNQNDFSLDFIALSFSQPTKNNYAYKLEGFDPEWNFIGNNKMATYTNLDEGKYTFRVKASNNDGLWNEKGASLKITILPAPWKTWWAYSLYLLATLTLVYYLRKLTITRIKEKNELKREKLEKEQLEQVNQLKLRLFTNISHDFRTPLTLIAGPVEQLLKLKNNNTVIKRNLETIQRNTNILLQLINELLDFRKNESGKLELYASKNDIIPFVENIKLSFEELALQQNITYNFTYTKDATEVWFDKIKMKKILFNLLSNAFKFTSKNNKISLHISTVLNDNIDLSMDKLVKIDITNYGKVIPKEHIEFIFDRFYQLDQQGVESGTGIGLSLTKSLVELHKGKITVSSSEEDGTCFSVLLPLGKAHLLDRECVNEIEKNTKNEIFDKPIYVQKEIRSQEIDAETIELEFDKNRSTLLIVEDNVEVRNFIKNIFISKYNIFESENGKNGIEIAKDKPIDLIISDIMMPIMDGFELSKQLKSNIRTSHIPIILLTAKTSLIHREEGYRTGADAYITKPFDATILEVRVDNLLKSRQSLISKFKKDIILKPKELTITSADEQFLEKAIKVVEDNISDSEFNVYAFTDQMHMSRSVLFRKLKALTDQSITTFIRTIKLKRAGQLLAQTKMNVSEVAYEVGFNDLKYFRKCFKKLFNEVPSDYRNKNNQNTINN